MGQEELVSKATGPEGDFVRMRHSVLETYLNGEGAPDPAKILWETRFYENEFFMKVYMLAEIPVSNLESQQATEREAFFKQSRDAWKETKHTLQLLEKHITLPCTLGNHIYIKNIIQIH